MSSLLSLAMLSGCYLNIPLQMGLGINEIFSERRKPSLDNALESFVFFISIFIQWLFFSFILTPLSLSFFKYFLLLPLCAVISLGIKTVMSKALPRFDMEKNIFLFPYKSGAGLAALLLIMYLAETTVEALVLAAGFSAGIFLSTIIIKSIGFRLERESINSSFRGIPLMLITMGLLSLAAMSIAIIYLR
jgi:electron transport complex protein RnfA